MYKYYNKNSLGRATMQIRELSQPVTSNKLNESLSKKFGYKINLEQFNDVQLEDARNKLRTKISQFEMNESFDSMLENHSYQKAQALLNVINQAILERESRSEDEKDVEEKDELCESCDCNPCKCDDEKAVEESYVEKTIRQRAMDQAVPESWINSALERMSLGESDNEELKSELKTRYDLNESQASWLLLEGEEDKAEIIMATKDMVDRITGWLEDVAAMKAEQLLELTDSIREQLGSDVAQQYTDAVKPALEAIYTALETSRQGLSTGLSTVSGEEAPTMGTPTLGATATPGASAPEATPTAAPDMAAAGDELAPPSAEAGREKRESVDYSRRLGILLNSKKK